MNGMLLSFVIPAYNVEKYIAKTLKSIQDQKDSQVECEVIIIDDGSTDNTLATIQGMIDNQAGSITYKVISQNNGGVSSARNLGLSECSGTYIIFLDGDDYMSSQLISNLYMYMNDEDNVFDVILWGYNIVAEDGATIQEYFDTYDSELNQISGIETLNNIINNKMWVSTGSIAFRRSLLLDNQFIYTEGCICAEDLEFIFKALSRANKVLTLNKVLSYYVRRAGSITNSYNIRKMDDIYAMVRVVDYIDALHKLDTEKIIAYIKGELIIKMYLVNWNSCLTAYSQEGHSLRHTIRTVLNVIEGYYPGLNHVMIAVMKQYKGNDKKLYLKVKLFLLSMYVYSWLRNFRNRSLTR